MSLISTNSLTPETPVVEDFWITASLTSSLLLPAALCRASASTTKNITELSRSPFGFGSNVSLSTLRQVSYLILTQDSLYDGASCSFHNRTFTCKINAPYLGAHTKILTDSKKQILRLAGKQQIQAMTQSHHEIKKQKLEEWRH